jgi:hypothetical protein
VSGPQAEIVLEPSNDRAGFDSTGYLPVFQDALFSAALPKSAGLLAVSALMLSLSD